MRTIFQASPIFRHANTQVPSADPGVVMRDSLVMAVPDTHVLAGARRLSISQLSADSFVSLPPHEGSVLPDRLRRLARACGFVADVVQVAPDTQTALALVSAQVGSHLTLASVASNVTDPHVVFHPTRRISAREWRRTSARGMAT